jgi:2-phospho-L-lactate guanylyltransferase
MTSPGVWAVLPIKDTAQAKQRLARALPTEMRQQLALAMAEDVLAALSSASCLAGIAVVTIDERAAALARRYGARVLTDGARDGHTGAVRAAVRTLTREGAAAILQVPGDIPLITPHEVEAVVTAIPAIEGFTIVPARDRRGSNAVLCMPPERVPLQFGDDSFLPHLAAARRCGVEPVVLALPGIGHDIDHPEDLESFMRQPSQTRTYAFLQRAIPVAQSSAQTF